VRVVRKGCVLPAAGCCDSACPDSAWWCCVLWVCAGVLIRRVNQTATAAQKLQPGDVLLSFDGQAIANDGTVPFR
jgi:hypothetical protein